MIRIVFILSVICVVLVFLLVRSCTDKPNTQDAQRDHEVDSIRQKAIADSTQWHKDKDSLSKINTVLSHQKDSLERIAAAGKQALKGKDVDISNLVDKINAAEANHNDSAALAACDSLKAQHPIIRQIAATYINANDSLKRVNDSIINFKNSIIARLNGLYSEANNSLFQISNDYGNQKVELQKAQKDAKRRFGIGPQISVGVFSGKIILIPAIGLHYTLIKW